MNPAYVFIILIALFVVIATLIGSRRQAKIAIEAKPILTPNELEFYHRLRRALPSYHIFPQVAFNAFLQVAKGTPAKSYYRSLNSFNNKTADFVVCEPDTLKITAIIELDDRTHNKEKDAKRDEMLAKAGYRTIRFQSKHKPSDTEIAALFPSTQPDSLPLPKTQF